MEDNNPAQFQNPIPQPVSPEPQPVKKTFFSKAIIAAFIIGIILILLPAGTYLFLNSNQKTACTTEAKICPDGSSVGRTGPKCEFQTCPKTKPSPSPTPDPASNAADATANWKTYTASNYSFRYPIDWFVNKSSDTTSNGPFEISDLQNSPTTIIGASDTHTRISISYLTGSMPTNFPLGNGDSSQNPTIKPFSKNGYTGIRGNSVSTAGTIDNVLLKDSNGGYIWIQLTPAQKDNATSGAIFNQILFTFKFTDSASSDTSAWKTYTGNGYSIEYPTNVTFKADRFYLAGDDNRKDTADGFGPNLSVLFRSEASAPESVAKQELGNVQLKNLTINNYVGVQAINSTTGFDYYLTPAPGGKVFRISFFSQNYSPTVSKESINTMRQIANQMLSTFKFTQ